MVAEESEFFLEHRKGESGIRTPLGFIPFLKEGQRPDVIICTPKGWNPLEEAGVIVPGSQTGHCDRCGQDIWLAPSTHDLAKEFPDLPIRCIDCLKTELESQGKERG